MLSAAATAIGSIAPRDSAAPLTVLPPLAQVGEVADAVALAVARQAVDEGVAAPLDDDQIVKVGRGPQMAPAVSPSHQSGRIGAMTTSQTQPSPWVLAGEPTSLGDPTGLITLVDGQTFCLSGRSGDFSTNPTHGVFFADMRVLSQARLLVGGRHGRAACGQLRRRQRVHVRRPVDRPSPNRSAAPRRSSSPASARCGTSRSRCATPARRRCQPRRTRGRCRLRRRVRDQGGPPSSEGEHSLEVKETQLAVRLAARRRSPTGRAECRRPARTGVHPWVRVERQHRATWSVHAATRSHALRSATRGSNVGTITPAFPMQPIATRDGCPRSRSCGPPTGCSARRSTARSKTSAPCGCTTRPAATDRSSRPVRRGT